MKRIILMLTVAAMMVAALAVTAPMAFAVASCEQTDNHGCKTTQEAKNSKFDIVTRGGGGGATADTATCGKPNCPPGQYK